jgi:hypothetical protein
LLSLVSSSIKLPASEASGWVDNSILLSVICHLSSALCPLSFIFGIHNPIDDFNCRLGTGNIMNPNDMGTIKYGGCHRSSGAGLNDGKIRLQVLVMPVF